MKISILCTDPLHPVVAHLAEWSRQNKLKGHDILLAHDKSELSGGDILFLVSCSQLIHLEEREKYKAVLVLHASNLPQGRGWSPHVWAILSGAQKITVCLLEARDPVDTGDIWLSKTFELQGHELLPEINEKLFQCELELMSEVVDKFDQIESVPQQSDSGDYLRRRSPQDSYLDVNKSIAEQFNLLRVVDNERYPAFFEYCGHKYIVKIEKA